MRALRPPPWLVRLLREDDGPTATEYAVMLALIVLVAMSTIGALGRTISGLFSGVQTAVQAAGG